MKVAKEGWHKKEGEREKGGKKERRWESRKKNCKGEDWEKLTEGDEVNCSKTNKRKKKKTKKKTTLVLAVNQKNKEKVNIIIYLPN